MDNTEDQFPIIAGHFDTLDQATHAEQALRAAGYAADKISTFYVNPPGQHDIFPIGGDRNESPGAKQTVAGLAVGGSGGAAIGAAIGAVGFPVAGVAAPVLGGLVGAHLGMLLGSLASTKEGGTIVGQDTENAEPVRKGGMLVAVGLASRNNETAAIDRLRGSGATLIERASGVIRDGDWIDFDPLSHPDYVRLTDLPPDL